MIYSYAEEFARYRITALKAVKDSRAEREKASRSQLPPEYDMLNHLAALKARVAPLKQDFINVMLACVNTCQALFSYCPDARSTDRLIELLNQGKTRLQLWRSSSARAGTDAALMLIMSWHEDIKLEKIQSLQIGRASCRERV